MPSVALSIQKKKPSIAHLPKLDENYNNVTVPQHNYYTIRNLNQSEEPRNKKIFEAPSPSSFKVNIREESKEYID